MLYSEFIKKQYKENKLASIYDDMDIFDYKELKKAYIDGDDKFRKELENTTTAMGNNLFKLSAIFGDVDLFKELFAKNKDEGLLGGQPVLAMFEFKEDISVSKLKEMEHFFLNKWKNKELNVDSITYAHACIQLIKSKHKDDDKEFSGNYPFNDLYGEIYKNIEIAWSSFSNNEKLNFYCYIEQELNYYKNREILEGDIENLMNLEKDQQGFMSFLLKDEDIINKHYFSIKNGKEINKEVEQELKKVEDEILLLFNNLDNKGKKIIGEWVKVATRNNSKKVEIVNKSNFSNLNVSFKKFNHLEDALNILQSKELVTRNKLMRKVIQNYSIDIRSYSYKDNLFEKTMIENGYDNFIIHRGNISDKETANKFLNNIKELPPIFNELIKVFPVYLESIDSNMAGALRYFNNMPICVTLNNESQSIIVHELTHVLQSLNEIYTDKNLSNNENWKLIKNILVEESDVSHHDLVDFITNIVEVPNEKYEKFKEMTSDHLTAYIKNNKYDFNSVLEKFNKKEFNMVSESLFRSFDLQAKNQGKFLSGYWRFLDSNMKFYYAKDVEIHARLNQYIYAKTENDNIIEKAVSYGINNDKVLIKIKPLLDKLNQELFDEIKEYILVSNLEDKQTVKKIKIK